MGLKNLRRDCPAAFPGRLKIPLLHIGGRYYGFVYDYHIPELIHETEELIRQAERLANSQSRFTSVPMQLRCDGQRDLPRVLLGYLHSQQRPIANQLERESKIVLNPSYGRIRPTPL